MEILLCLTSDGLGILQSEKENAGIGGGEPHSKKDSKILLNVEGMVRMMS